MAYRLVWLCLDIIEELEAKYGRGFMGEFDGDGVFEMFQLSCCFDNHSESYLPPFQKGVGGLSSPTTKRLTVETTKKCKVCENARIAESEGLESSVDWDIFQEKVRELETRISQDFR